MQDSPQSTRKSIAADAQRYRITNIVLECNLEDTDHRGPTTMNVKIFSPERKKTGEVLILKKESRLVWKHQGSVELMGNTAFLATWDYSGNGIVKLTKAELKEFTTDTGSDKGVRREILMETNDITFKLRLSFNICMASEEMATHWMQDSPHSTRKPISADAQRYRITNIVLECNNLEDTDRRDPATMNVKIFSPERKTGEVLILKKESRLVWKHQGSVELMGNTTFRATWDYSSKGVVNLKGAELKEFTASTGSDKGVRREILMETNDIAFKLRLKFNICCMASEEREVAQIEEEPSDLYHKMAEAEDPVEMFRIILELSDNMPDKADLLANCGAGFLRNFHSNNQKEDIDNCILAFESAVHLTPQGHSDMAGRMKMLGLSYNNSFDLTGDLNDISKAILYHQKAVHITPEGHASMPNHLNNLGVSFRCRFERTRDLADISDAISYQQKVVHLIPEDHASLPRFLNNLGMSFESRFECTGDLADIFEAISCRQGVVRLAPEGHADMPGYLNNLGNSFLLRFQSTGDLADISIAISYQQKAIHLTPEDHASMPSHLNDLGNSFLRRFQCTGDLADISDAILYQRKAVRLTPGGHVSLPRFLNDLGMSFQCRFECTGDLADKSNAISNQQKAVHLTPEDHLDLKSRIDACPKDCASLRFSVQKKREIPNATNLEDDRLLAENIRKWLAAPDSSRNQNEARDKRVDTCAWFFEGERFRVWLENPGFLWVKGKPGCGKTILCSWIVDRLPEATESLGIAYFFFDGRDSQKQLHNKLIRTLISQLCDTRHGCIVEDLADLYKQCEDLQPSDEQLQNVLCDILDRFSQAYIIIDALDECTDREKTLNWINNLVSDRNCNAANLHIVVTSRPKRDINEIFAALDPHSIDIGEANERAIKYEIYEKLVGAYDWFFQRERFRVSFITLKYILSTAVIVSTLVVILGISHESRRNAQQGALPSSSEGGFQDNQFGLLELAPGLNPAIDIVAIHGLDGHRLHSWTAENGVCWLQDLLGLRVSEARILTYGYDANTRGREQLSYQSLYSHAQSLISNLALERRATETEERPIIFVAHSLGGIVLKNALVHAHLATKGNLFAHKAVALSTYGIIFLGTPHQGTQNAEFARILLNIQAITRPVNDGLVKHLSRNSEALEQQLSQFTSISKDFVIKFGFETYPTYLGGGFRDLIVSRASAVVPGMVDAEAISINKNHMNMSKYPSAEDEDFKTIWKHLSIMAKAAPLKIAMNWEHHRHFDGV